MPMNLLARADSIPPPSPSASRHVELPGDKVGFPESHFRLGRALSRRAEARHLPDCLTELVASAPVRAATDCPRPLALRNRQRCAGRRRIQSSTSLLLYREPDELRMTVRQPKA